MDSIEQEQQVTIVRIAPIEHWCEGYRASAAMRKLAGMEIEIIPSSMEIVDGRGRYHSGPCRWWAISERTRALIEDVTGLPDSDGWSICEHLLEMD
jgi:hypothetical protein